jgi:RnfABCDGE-type electron transport complex B subunit
MNPIFLAIVSVSVIGLILAILLAVASKFMAVKTDERVALVREVLPGANCGACGFAGCDAYAAAVVEEGAAANLCIPGGGATAARIAELLGVEAADVHKKIAALSCRGDCEHTSKKHDYQGEQTCKAAKMFFGGPGKCSYGCMGFGDCAAVCPVDAITVCDGIAKISAKLCIGCGACVKVCPSQVIRLIPEDAKVYTACNSRDKGAVTRKNCTAGCIACKKCEKTCPVGAIVVENNLAKIDYDKCTACGACAEACPTGAIAVRTKTTA